MKNWSQSKWYKIAVITGFISILSFFQIDSAWADAHNFNGIFGWLGIGIASCIAGVYCIYKAVSK